MRALTPADLTKPAGLSAYSALPSRHSALNHASCPPVALPVASAPSVASRLRHERAGSPQTYAEAGSSSYGLPVHLRLLPTPPRGDAVTIDYGAYDWLRRGLAPRCQSVLTDALVPAKAGTQGQRQTARPGPPVARRLRGGDEFVCPQDSLTGSFGVSTCRSEALYRHPFKVCPCRARAMDDAAARLAPSRPDRHPAPG
jgi:hypothetical protein